MVRLPVVVLAAVLAVTTALVPGVAAAAPPRFAHLAPGGQPELAERLPVNVVLVGYDTQEVDRTALRRGLPTAYEPVVRSRASYGRTEKLGIRYTYDYRVSAASRSYEDRFFGELKRLARRAPLTDQQRAYNDQDRNARTLRSNWEISAPAVERWLATNAPRGVDTRRNTVFLVNWWGRSDFRHHGYVKSNEPDPDTGYNFGAERDSRRLVAWGGTTARDEENPLGSTRRVWFHDLSAGPDEFSGGWNVDNADLDGDDEPDYRIPPAWEYGRYRPASALTGDLVRLVRYVALDLLFTTSPLYPVELPPAEPPRSVNLDSNVYEGWRGVDASRRYLDPGLLTAELRELLRLQRLDYDSQDLPFTGDAARCYDLLFEGAACYPGGSFPSFANLYRQNLRELARTQDDRGRVDYELPIFSYAVDDEPVPALGFADDDYADGDQTFVFAFVSPEVVAEGYGLTTTLIHEVGHHVGLSHPHDGYDSTSGASFGPSGEHYFAWLGDQGNSVMSYIDLNWDFSQFDADNLDRFRTAALVEAANRLAGQALAAASPTRAYPALQAADRLTGLAEQAFARHEYVLALGAAQAAYELARAGAEAAGVDLAAADLQARRAQVAAREAAGVHQGGEFIDSLDGPRGAR